MLSRSYFIRSNFFPSRKITLSAWMSVTLSFTTLFFFMLPSKYRIYADWRRSCFFWWSWIIFENICWTLPFLYFILLWVIVRKLILIWRYFLSDLNAFYKVARFLCFSYLKRFCILISFDSSCSFHCFFKAL